MYMTSSTPNFRKAMNTKSTQIKDNQNSILFSLLFLLDNRTTNASICLPLCSEALTHKIQTSTQIRQTFSILQSTTRGKPLFEENLRY